VSVSASVSALLPMVLLLLWLPLLLLSGIA